jgi:hypothetical protein
VALLSKNNLVIVNAVIALVVTVVKAFDSLFPDLTLPTWFTSDAIGSTVANYIGSLLGAVSGWFPVAATLNVLYTVTVMLPFIAAYLVAEWVWRHVPTIFGFGTGNG